MPYAGAPEKLESGARLRPVAASLRIPARACSRDRPSHRQWEYASCAQASQVTTN